MSKKISSIVLAAVMLFSLFSVVLVTTETSANGGTIYVWDQPFVNVQGTEDAFPDGWWVRGNSTGVGFTFSGLDPEKIVSEFLDVTFSLGVTNHMNGEEGLDGLLDVVINPSIDNYLIQNVLFDNVDPLNLVWAMGAGGSYETKAHVTVDKRFIHDGTLVLKVERHVDVKDNLPAAPIGTNVPIDLGTQSDPTPAIPTGVYDNDDAHTVHIHVATTTPGGNVAAPGEVVMRPSWLAPGTGIGTGPGAGSVYVWDQAGVYIQGTEDPFPDGWWVRGNSTGVGFTFTGLDPTKIVSEYLDVEFSLGVTNHLNGEEGLDGLLDVVINPSLENYLIQNVLFDNVDPANLVWAMGIGGSYETKAHITVHKQFIHSGVLVIKVERHVDVKDNLPAAPIGSNVPVDLGTQTDPTPVIPTGVYDNNDAHTVHIHVATTAAGGDVAAAGEVVIRPEWLALFPPTPHPIPAVGIIGLFTMVTLLSASIVLILNRQRRIRRANINSV